MDDDVLQLWVSFPSWIKGTTLVLILTYLTTLMAAFYGIDFLPALWIMALAFWPFVVMVWIAIIWFGFSLIVTVGVWIGGMFVKNPAENISVIRKAKKVILYIPIIIGSILSVSVVFMSDIFNLAGDGKK